MTHTTQDETTSVAWQLAALKARLEALEHEPTLDGGVLTLAGLPADDGPLPTVELTCKPWNRDGGRMYLWLGDRPMVEVSTTAHVVDAALLLHHEFAAAREQA